jgi:hypothetical protein
MEVDVSSLHRSREELKFLEDRRNRMNLIRESFDELFTEHFNESPLSLRDPLLHRKQELSYVLLEAAIHMANSGPDAVLRVVTFELLPDGAVPEKQIAPKEVKQRLDHEPVRSAIERMLDSPDYGYIRAAANTLKHRSLIQEKTRLDSSGFYGPVASAFVIHGKSFPEKTWVDVFDDVDGLFSLVVAAIAAVVEAANR